MAIEIVEIIDSSTNKARATVNHCGHIFEGTIVGKVEEISRSVGQKITVEIDYEHLSHWCKLEDFTDELSCICKSAKNSNIIIRGRVHNRTPLDDETSIVDIYLQQGPEFVAVDSRELDNTIPEVGDGVELQVRKISFYPVNL